MFFNFFILCTQEYMGERNALSERHGQGWAYLPNGDYYKGRYRRGMRHGLGLYVFKNGARYLGSYKCNLKSGIGKFYYPDCTTYYGEWRKDLKHGHGVYTYPNGDYYEGAWYKGQQHGVGTYTFKEHDCSYYGTWNHGIRKGPGEIITSQYRFHCTWNEINPIGPAVFSFDCDTMLTGYVTMTEEIGGKLQFFGQTLCKYDFSKLPPEPMPQPVSDSEAEICQETPVASVLDLIDYEQLPAGYGEEEEEEEEEGGIEAVGNEYDV